MVKIEFGVLIAVFALGGCATTMPSDTATFEHVVSLPDGVDAGLTLVRTREWFATYFESANHAVRSVDEDRGTLEARVTWPVRMYWGIFGVRPVRFEIDVYYQDGHAQMILHGFKFHRRVYGNGVWMSLNRWQIDRFEADVVPVLFPSWDEVLSKPWRPEYGDSSDSEVL